jgi:hypothetical protein
VVRGGVQIGESQANYLRGWLGMNEWRTATRPTPCSSIREKWKVNIENVNTWTFVVVY